jgi:deazaflavin-dependent oxidoreductase (nitroreductase family)
MRPLRRFAIRFVNPVTKHFAGWLPGFALLIYRGRTTGRIYRTPINVFRRGDHYVFALTYSSNVQWVKNVIAADGCDIQTVGRRVRLVEPELLVDPAGSLVPLPVRYFLIHVARVSEYLRMRAVSSESRQTPP